MDLIELYIFCLGGKTFMKMYMNLSSSDNKEIMNLIEKKLKENEDNKTKTETD